MNTKMRSQRRIICSCGPIALLLAACANALAASLSGTLSIDGRASADAIVFLERSDGGSAPAAEVTPVVMDQKNLQFLPRVLPVVKGTTVEFTNSDDIQHNVFSPSNIAGKFDLGTYGPGAARTVTLNEPGEVLVLCNIHMEMEAHIVVLREPYFALTAADGSYRIADVPPGTYTAKVWDDRFLPGQRSVTLTEPGELKLDLELTRR
jgi:plastocyanin